MCCKFERGFEKNAVNLKVFEKEHVREVRKSVRQLYVVIKKCCKFERVFENNVLLLLKSVRK